MSIPITFFLLNLFIISAMILRPTAATIDDFNWLPKKGGQCSGSIAECMIESELEMESESTRRILATTNYISYGALKGNNVPCSQRGTSYYNCQSGGQANPYQRGCSTITRCQR
ncbi:rapid alkalinization factor-like [Rutidosis leptorrhynchoides]|uniref:rapid alkalinization factor-like n=1 Tax=Rutidosis leptorrhynchoides TaxID=125765 RepID=UPI003A99E88C